MRRSPKAPSLGEAEGERGHVRKVAPVYKPFVRTFTVLWGGFIYSLHALLYLTCRKEIHGTEYLAGQKNVIYCGWHETIVPFLVTYWHFDHPHVQLINDAWFMEPIHFIVRRMRMRVLVPVATGSSGQEAAAEVVRYLQQGYSTLIHPDGPAGPVKALRRGVLHIAAKSGVPIVPFRTYAPVAWVWTWSWDKKRVPLPFSRVIVEYQRPIVVTPERIGEAEEALRQALG